MKDLHPYFFKSFYFVKFKLYILRNFHARKKKEYVGHIISWKKRFNSWYLFLIKYTFILIPNSTWYQTLHMLTLQIVDRLLDRTSRTCWKTRNIRETLGDTY